MSIIRLPKWLRRIVRRRMQPVSEVNAWDKKQKYAKWYAFFAWNALLLVIYQVYNGNKHWPVTAGLRSPEEEFVRPSIHFAHLMGIKKAQVYKISGLTVSEPEAIEINNVNGDGENNENQN